MSSHEFWSILLSSLMLNGIVIETAITDVIVAVVFEKLSLCMMFYSHSMQNNPPPYSSSSGQQPPPGGAYYQPYPPPQQGYPQYNYPPPQAAAQTQQPQSTTIVINATGNCSRCGVSCVNSSISCVIAQCKKFAHVFRKCLKFSLWEWRCGQWPETEIISSFKLFIVSSSVMSLHVIFRTRSESSCPNICTLAFVLCKEKITYLLFRCFFALISQTCLQIFWFRDMKIDRFLAVDTWPLGGATNWVHCMHWSLEYQLAANSRS